MGRGSGTQVPCTRAASIGTAPGWAIIGDLPLLPGPVVPLFQPLPPFHFIATGMHRHRVAGLVALQLCAGFAASPAWADAPDAGIGEARPAEPAPAPRTDYALGLALIDRPSYAGSSSMQWKLRPLWTIKRGRFRLSGARSSGLLGRPGEDGSGASAELVETPLWRIGASLGIDSGRSSADDPRLAGLPDLRRTLRGKVYAHRDLSRDWGLSMNHSQDLLGRGGGATAGLDLGYGRWLAPGLRGSVGGGLTWADARYMRAQFGIAPEVAQRAGREAFEPGAGLRDMHLGANVQWAVSGAWFGFAAVGTTRLMGDAAQSPLTTRRNGGSVAVGLAWRNLP